MFGLTPKRVFFVAFVVAAIFLAKQYVPPLFSRVQFGDSVRQTVRYAATSQMNIEAVRREIVSAAGDYGINITPKDVVIVTRGPSFTVDINYSWPIDLRFHKYDMQFHVSETGESFER
jgi:hypothetical protein